MEPLSQSRQVVAFAIAVNPDTFAVDEVEVEAVDFGLFEESVELTLEIEGCLAYATAEQRSVITENLLEVAGSFHSEASCIPPGTSTEAFGQSLFNLTFAVQVDKTIVQ